MDNGGVGVINILVAEDDKHARKLLETVLKREGYHVFTVENGKKVLEILDSQHIDLIVLDIMMPEMDGYETLKRMKEIRDVPCIFLTAMGQEYDRIYGFDIGAEDYVTKPFSPKELMMRIKVILKRENKDTNRIIVNGLMIDTDAHMVSIDGEKIDLANKEFELLLYLMKNMGNALTRQSIISKVWGYEYDSDDRTLDTHMKLLRKDLKEYGRYITTIRGVGYRFEKEI